MTATTRINAAATLLFSGLVLSPALLGQGVAPRTAGNGEAAPAQDVARGVELDRLVAVVNDDVILESDVDEERRLAAFQPLQNRRRTSERDQAINRLIDRKLILQQAQIQNEAPITDQQVDEQLAELRKVIPACQVYKCETAAGWEKFVAAQGFTMEELRRRWRDRMEVLQFIEVRFRSGIQITDAEIQEYYEKTLLPQYASAKATPPKVETISDRIQEILLQQQVGALLGDWLKALRAQGTVRTVQPGEATP